MTAGVQSRPTTLRSVFSSRSFERQLSDECSRNVCPGVLLITGEEYAQWFFSEIAPSTTVFTIHSVNREMMTGATTSTSIPEDSFNVDGIEGTKFAASV